MFKKRNRAWLAALLAGALVAGALVAGLTPQASATTAAPDRPTGLTADLDDGGVLLSWDAPAETVDSWQVLRKFHPAETTHTVVATVDGELNEWTDTDLTAGDRRYKVAAVRDSLTSRRSRVAKLMLDEPPPPPLSPTPGTITQVPEKELLTERGAGDTCTPAANSVTATLDTWTNLSSSENWVQVTLMATHTYLIYAEKLEGGRSTIDFVCGPDEIEIANTTAAYGTGLGSSDALLRNFIPAATGLHYVKITTTGIGGKSVLVAKLGNDEDDPVVAVGGTATGTFGTPIDIDGVEVPMVSGKSYQIDLRSVGYPGIDPWIRDIYDNEDRVTRTGRCDYTNYPPTCTTFFGAAYPGFFDHDSGPGNAARVIYTATKTENHIIVFGSRGRPRLRLGDWHVKVTEASAPFYDDYAADASTSGAVSVGGSVSGEINSTPSWYNAGDTGGPDGYSTREPGYTGPKHGFSCHEVTGDGIALDGDTCDRDWFAVTLIRNRTYKLQLESESDLLLIDGVYRFGSQYQKGGGTYTAGSNGTHYISVAGTNGCSGLHGCTGSYTLRVTEE